MELWAAQSEQSIMDWTVEDVWYTFVLDATDGIASKSDDDRQISLAATLRRNALGLGRSEDADSVVHERLSAMVGAAENLLREAGFDFEWFEGYCIYYDGEV